MESTARAAAALEEMLAKAQIREVLETYFHGLDARREDLLTSCFTADAEARHHCGSDSEFTLTGGAQIAGYFCALMKTFKASHHAAGSVLIRIAADTAQAETFATATVVANDGRVRVRGLKYADTFVRAEDGWRIHRRTHTPIWQYETETVRPFLPR